VSALEASVTVIKRRGRELEESETRVGSLGDLFDLCRNAASSDLVRVSLRGPEGEVRLSLTAFIRRG
jgi:hypothetical protein